MKLQIFSIDPSERSQAKVSNPTFESDGLKRKFASDKSQANVPAGRRKPAEVPKRKIEILQAKDLHRRIPSDKTQTEEPAG